ncbi:wiskott-Aldrich syndrome protein family member 3 isoform X2 [Thrips palmi]|uniref:Wiskott-Aldrich syndrome protein family member n=1 Tax=Thrips palmi TaxID=161013 RepID=A0A6P8ZXP8_THRPL|nr:wiskott-Aldrich syndrome protein family member 3 isoform X2 [Thrips palmi]
MPLPKRMVEPVLVSRNTIPDGLTLPSELEAATNGTLANIIRQLSSLSRHAEDLFGELEREAHNLQDRSNSLQARIDKLAIKVTQLDSNVEEVSLQDIHMRKAFKSTVVFDQQVVSRDTMPTAMLETYQQCDKPPPLRKLNPYRDDGKDGLKFYTDPNYFFDLWRQEMLKDTERMMHDRGKKPHRPRNEGGGGRHKKRVRQPHNTRERQKQLAVGHGEYIMPQNVHYRTPQPVQHPDEALLVMDSRPPRPNSIEVRSNYPDHADGHYSPQPSIHSQQSQYGQTSQYGQPVGQHYSQTQQYASQHMQQQLAQQGQIGQMNASQPPAPLSPSDTSHYKSNYAGSYEDSGYYGTDAYTSPNSSIYGRSAAARANSQRPSQPPPAPPSANNSSNSTPTGTSATNTPTRGRSMSAGRDTLPPPPPPPTEVTTNGPVSGSAALPGLPGLPSHLLNRTNSASGSRSGSPHSTPTPTPPRQLSRDETPEPLHNDMLPPPPLPPIADMPPAAAPPPPPPPPPLPSALPNGLGKAPGSTSPPLTINGDVGKSPNKQTSPPKMGDQVAARKVHNIGPVCDTRNDLLKAIRDGIKLRKVEKIEQKEVERVNALHDVASILARRVAVEFSDSDSASESEYDSDGWVEQETSA